MFNEKATVFLLHLFDFRVSFIKTVQPAGLTASGFSLLPAACGAAEVLSGQEWQAQQRGAVSSQPLPSPRPTGGNPASAAGSQAGSH